MTRVGDALPVILWASNLLQKVLIYNTGMVSHALDTRSEI